ncbi:MAG TPA: periplasmic heavy metal sensor [Burkholderiales bacterium]|nr:periplasmic heavy metal sensor [Burkholderiales bacterium]
MFANEDRQPRRRFFKLAAATTAVAGLGGFGLNALAHGRGQGRGPIDPARAEEHLDRMLKHMYVEIDATEAQKHKLDPIAKQAVKDLQPLREKSREARLKSVELLAADKIDRGAIEKARAESMRAADATSKRFTQALADFAEVLTPEQRKTLAARMQRRGGRRGGMMFG